MNEDEKLKNSYPANLVNDNWDELLDDEIKYMNIKEFREKGYLQEVNRRFFHPLGLALSIKIDERGNEYLGDIWDSREDEEGFIYDLINADEERIENFKKNADFIDKEFNKRIEKRLKLLGDVVEPIVRSE